jgi:hypothetical protein
MIKAMFKLTHYGRIFGDSMYRGKSSTLCGKFMVRSRAMEFKKTVVPLVRPNVRSARWAMKTFNIGSLHADKLGISGLLGLREIIQKSVAEDRLGSITMEIMTSKTPSQAIFQLPSLRLWRLGLSGGRDDNMLSSEMLQSPKKATLSIRVLATNYLEHIRQKFQ